MAYFPTTASGPGIVGEMLTAAIGQNADALADVADRDRARGRRRRLAAQALGLPEAFDGLLTDTASTSSIIALAAAREAAGIDAAAQGLGGRPGVPRLRVYASAEAHSSIEKACMTLGLGRASYVAIPTDAEYRLRPDALERAIAADRAAGHRPIAIVATVGTTSSTSVDPVAEMSRIAREEGLWLHVDAAYGGAAAILPEERRAVPRLGGRRFDRREPPQVAVHAARRVALPVPPPRAGPSGVQPRTRSTCGRSIGRRRSATTTSSSRSSGAASGR